MYASCGVLLNLMKIPKLRPSLLKNGGVKKYDISMPKSVHIHIHEGGIAVAIVAQWQSTVVITSYPGFNTYQMLLSCFSLFMIIITCGLIITAISLIYSTVRYITSTFAFINFA